MPDEVRALYLNSGVVSNVDAYIKIAKNSGINAFVVDIKITLRLLIQQKLCKNIR